MSETKPQSTASILGAFRRELEAEGIGAEYVDELVIHAARQLLDTQGLNCSESYLLDTVTFKIPRLDIAAVKAAIADLDRKRSKAR